ncbi:ABC transporter ATP-binding protein [Mesorhizobium sp. RP14(2022)]|uniref:ABC transporter ATP-binding protein n=1 Tax=Mesorhizobium liriopis TaxID=2953882 RepID=A0ABT1C675_9HYPH|nr:ABC transporter ATP-binding protein [Mesorhizobium liriopis]MCO6050328.1 ABC transporter ATP-binding protein [Mesorhizobium liriopis]
MSLLDVAQVDFAYGRGRAILSGLSFVVEEGETVGLVGESGSGKTTLLRLALGLQRPSGGTIRFDGAVLDPGDRSSMRQFRRQVQVVFQDPYSSLDPRQKVGAIVAEPLRSLRVSGDHRRMVEQALDAVGLDTGMVDRYPHQFSGGQRQRIAIARAVVCRPRLLLADEAVSALDLSTRLRIVELFKSLGHTMSLLFVSHDIGAVAALCRRVLILEKGRIVEVGDTAQVLSTPQHPYTRRLLDAVPRLAFGETP